MCSYVLQPALHVGGSYLEVQSSFVLNYGMFPQETLFQLVSKWTKNAAMSKSKLLYVDVDVDVSGFQKVQ